RRSAPPPAREPARQGRTGVSKPSRRRNLTGELGVTGGARTRGLQSHILAFSPTELPTPQSRKIDDEPPCSRPAVGCRRRCRQLVPSGSPRASDRSGPRTRVSALKNPSGAGLGRVRWLVTDVARRYRAPSPFEPVAGYSDPQKDRPAWRWPFTPERLGASQASSI